MKEHIGYVSREMKVLRKNQKKSILGIKNIETEVVLFFYIILEVLAITLRKGNKTYTYWGGRNKTFFFTNDLTINVKIFKIINQKLMEIFSTYSKI